MKRKISHHFAEVICVDTVSHTNKDKCPLLKISGRERYNKLFDALEKTVKMLMLNEKEGLPILLEWFNHLLIYNKEDIPIKIKEPNFPECTYFFKISRLNQETFMRLKSTHLQVLSRNKL